MARSGGLDRMPVRPATAVPPSTDATMLTVTCGRSSGGGRSVTSYTDSMSTSPAEGNRRSNSRRGVRGLVGGVRGHGSLAHGHRGRDVGVRGPLVVRHLHLDGGEAGRVAFE